VIQRSARAFTNAAAFKDRMINLTRAVLLPSQAPDVCSFAPGCVNGMVASLRALSKLPEQQLRSLGAQGRAFVEVRYDIRRLNREMLATAMDFRREREVAAEEIVY
jgi:hypothetical protein